MGRRNIKSFDIWISARRPISENGREELLVIDRGAKVLEGQQRVTQTARITIVYEYPLHGTHEIIHNRKTGWTLQQICAAVQNDYKKIYDRPNRYGIWGHGIGDLVIESIQYNPRNRKVILGIGS